MKEGGGLVSLTSGLTPFSQSATRMDKVSLSSPVSKTFDSSYATFTAVVVLSKRKGVETKKKRRRREEEK